MPLTLSPCTPWSAPPYSDNTWIKSSHGGVRVYLLRSVSPFSCWGPTVSFVFARRRGPARGAFPDDVFHWLIWKLLIWVRYGGSQFGFRKHAVPIPLLLFFTFVTISLFPDYFHRAADYRYFFLGSMHYLMIFDLCSDQKRWRLIFYLLALSPGLLAVRGILYDSLVLELDQMRRFGYPLPHPNIAGYLFAMTLPLCLAIAVGERGRMRALSLLSCGAQLLALILTYSRGSWLGWWASIFSFGVMLKRWREIWVILATSRDSPITLRRR